MNNYLGVCLGLILIIFCLLGCSTSNYGHFKKLPDMNVARARHKSFLMQDGRVLIFGGDGEVVDRGNGLRTVGERPLKTAEIFDPKTNTFTMTKGFHQVRFVYNAIQLDDGNILITGGDAEGQVTLKSSQIYDPIKDKIINGPNMHFAKYSHSSVKLKDGRILIFGGKTGIIGKDWYSTRAEIYDPKLNKFILLTDSPNFMYDRLANTCVLSDGKIFIVNRLKKNNKAELFDPLTNKFEVINKVLTKEAKEFNSYYLNKAVYLKGDKILIFETNKNDLNNIKIYDIKEKTLQNIGRLKIKDKKGFQTTLLKNENILITGGSVGVGLYRGPIKKAELFNTKSFESYNLPNLNYKRFTPSTILLNDGRVLITGGRDNSEKYQKNAEIYIPN